MPLLNVLYGSQTGNAQSIAEDIFAEVSRDREASLQTLNAAKKLHLTEEPLVFVIVCSTTGNGDPPENAESWWRSVKLKATPTDAFQNVHFAVLGLGDTNYDKFAHMGKVIDKRLEELGGHRFLPLHSADEATNMEEIVTQFRSQLSIALDDLVVSLQGKRQNPETSHAETPPNSMADLVKPLLKLAEETKLLQVKHFKPAEGVLDLLAISRAMDIKVDIEGPPPANILPTARSNGKSEYRLENTKADSNKENLPGPEGWNSEYPYLASVLDAKWLTTEDSASDGDWDEARRVIHMELSLGESGIKYNPGDSIGVKCPNPNNLVDVALNRVLAAEGLQSSDDYVVWENDKKERLGDFLRYK